MLNHLFHGSAGFAWGVRAQAFLTLGLLIPANLLMRQPPRRAPSPDLPKARLIAMLTDVPYILTIIGQVTCFNGGMKGLAHVFYFYFWEQWQPGRHWRLFPL